MFDSIDSVVEDGTARKTSVSALTVAVALFNALIYATSRYVPEYLRATGAHPVVIGLFGSVVMLLAVLYPYLGSYVRDRFDGLGTRHLIGGLVSLGLVCWLVAPQLGRLWAIPTWGYVVVGAVLVGTWRSVGFGTTVASAGDGWLYGQEADLLPVDEPVQFIGLVGAILLLVGVLNSVSDFVAGFQVVLALAASLGATVTALLYCSDVRPGRVSSRTLDGPLAVVSNLRSIPRRLRPLLVGDTLIRFALGMIAVFVIVTVTSVLRVEAHVLGYRLGPSAFFGVLMLVEISVALAASVPAARFSSETGRNAIVLLSALASASFPLLLIGVPATPLAVGILFVVFGLRFAGRPARRELIDVELESGEGAGSAGSYRLVRDILAVPSALTGGVLYAISPSLAFMLSTIVGVIGLRELMEFTIRPHVD